jgi:hypothetical protein
MSAMSSTPAQVAEPAHHVFLLGELDHAAADVAVGGADDLRDRASGMP